MNNKIFLLFFLILTSIGLVSGALSDNLVNYYKLDEVADATAIDYSDSNNLLVHSSVGSTTGIIENSRVFGSGTLISEFPINQTTTQTFNMWVYPIDLTGYKVIFGTDLEFSWGTLLFSSHEACSGGMYLQVGAGTAGPITGGCAAALTPNTWQMVTVVARGTYTELYLNAVSIFNLSAVTNMDIQNKLVLGNNEELRDLAFFSGYMDEFSYWNRDLTNNEIEQLYNSGNGLAYPFVITPPCDYINVSGEYILSNSVECIVVNNDNVIIQGNGYTINSNISVANYNGLIINNTNINGSIIYPTPSTPDYIHQVLVLYNTTVIGNIQMQATRPYNSGDQGNTGGELTAYNSLLGNIIAYGGTGTYTGGRGGTVTLSNSISGDIDVHGTGIGVTQPGGTVILYSSNTSNIDLSSLGCAFGCSQSNGGILTRTVDSVTGLVNISGVNSDGTITIIPLVPIVIPPTYENQTFENKTTTDLTTVPNIQAVENFTIATTTSAVEWLVPVDLSNVTNVATVIITSNSFIAVNKQAVPSLDTLADVVLTVPPAQGCTGFELYYATGFYSTAQEIVNNGQLVATSSNIGGDCIDDTICKNVQCVGGVLTFEAQHFDGFGVGLKSITAQESCQSTRNQIFAAFSLIALFIIVGAAFLVVNLTKGEFDSTSIIVAIVGFIAVAIVVFVGYLIISQVSAGICVI